jgi:hypothetical protein
VVRKEHNFYQLESMKSTRANVILSGVFASQSETNTLSKEFLPEAKMLEVTMPEAGRCRPHRG